MQYTLTIPIILHEADISTEHTVQLFFAYYVTKRSKHLLHKISPLHLQPDNNNCTCIYEFIKRLSQYNQIRGYDNNYAIKSEITVRFSISLGICQPCYTLSCDVAIAITPKI